MVKENMKSNEVVREGKVCKEEILSLISLPEGEKNKILLYNNEKIIVVIVFDELTKNFLTYSTERIDDNIYKYGKKSVIKAIVFGENISYKDEILESEVKNEINIYNINSNSYFSDKYKLYRKLTEEENTTIKNYLKLIKELN